jgi:hypothetical protein
MTRRAITLARQRPCAHCGSLFIPRKDQLDRGVGTCCSNSCAQSRRHGTEEECFWAKVARADGDECWLWKAAVHGNGYGNFRSDNAQCAAWRLTHGPIPDGLEVCHSCDVPLCVRPDHLFLGTPKENTQDAKRKGRLRGGRAFWKTPHTGTRDEARPQAQLSAPEKGD